MKVNFKTIINSYKRNFKNCLIKNLCYVELLNLNVHQID